MKPILLILTMLVSFKVLSQTPLKIEQYIAFDVGLFPDRLTVNGIEYKDINEGISSDGRLPPVVSGSRVYLCVGLAVEYKLASKVFMRTGLGYWNRKFGAKQIDPPVHRMRGGATSFAIRHFDLSQGIRYYLTTSRLAVYADAGLAGSWLYKNKAYRPDGYKNDRYDVDPLPMAKLSLSAYAGIGAGFSFSPVWQMNIAVVYKNGITPYIDGQDYRMKSIGVAAGVAVKLGERSMKE